MGLVPHLIPGDSAGVQHEGLEGPVGRGEGRAGGEREEASRKIQNLEGRQLSEDGADIL